MYCSKDLASTLYLNTDRQTPELSVPSAINDLTDDANNGKMTLLDENISNVCQNLEDSSRNSSLCQNAEDILQIPNDCQNTQDTSKYFKVCYVCGKVVHNVSIHLKMSHGEHKCGKCCQLFKTALELSSHQELHEDNKYACDKCDLSFKKAFQYAIHYKEHSLLKDYKCPICNFTTLSRPSINNHIRYHENRYRFFCEECGRGFMNSTVCKEHVEGHSGIKRYKCDICNKSFLYSRYLSAHRKFNHKAILEGVEEVHECHVCHRRFSFGKSLIRHLSKIHRIGKDLRVKCNICQKQIANPYNLKMHMRIHTGEKPYICEKCGRGFTKKVYLRRHCDANHPEELVPFIKVETNGLIDYKKGVKKKLLIKHKDDDDDEFCPNSLKRTRQKRIWTCSKCPERFGTSTLLREHRKGHRNKDNDIQYNYKYDEERHAFTCDTCDVEYVTNEEMEQHVLKHEETFTCNMCNMSFINPCEYSCHLYSHDQSKGFCCPFCQYITMRRTTIMKHINSFHLQKFIYICTTCGKGFNDCVAYKEHYNIHAGVRPFKCIVCQKDFPFSSYLTTHQLRSHRVTIDGTIGANQCAVCLKIFSRPNTLEKHMRVHTAKKVREKNHLCDICGKGFARKEKLVVHYRVHTGYKPYTCSYCSKGFTKREYLVMHERVHSGEKPYSCEYCGRCFNQGAPLRLHIRSHTGERPYICHICNNGFISRGVLNVHLKNCPGIV